MEKRNLTCIGCPMGCQITVEFEGEEVFSVIRKSHTLSAQLLPQSLWSAVPKRGPASRRVQTFRRTRSSSAWMRSTKSAPRLL